jgi:hypothetical protein
LAQVTELKESGVYDLIAYVISHKRWTCKYLMRLVLIMLKEATKRQPAKAVDFLTDTLKLLTGLVEAAPWTKEPSVWQNLRQGLVIFIATYRKEETVKELF